jgi:hypothetical protein
VYIALGLSLIAIKLRWKVRSHVSFWAAILVVLAIQVPLLLMVRWPHGKGPTILYSMPIGVGGFLITIGTIRLAGKVLFQGFSV